MNPTILLVGLGLLIAFLVARVIIQRSQRISPGELMQLVAQGAQIVDVRTPQEFATAHAKGSYNIPLDQLSQRTTELDRTRPVVVCCASGTRSAMAKSLLERQGFTSVHNAGPWQNATPENTSV